MKKLMKFYVHWLVYGFIIDSKKKLEQFLKLAQNEGAVGVELPWEPLMGLGAYEVAELLQKYGMRHIGLCVFFGQNGPDPLSPQGKQDALNSIWKAMDFIMQLRINGIDGTITGPFAYQISTPYKKGVRAKVLDFLRAVKKMARSSRIICCLESLREAENHAVGDSRSTIRIVRKLKSPWMKVHLDTFHMQLWNEKMSQVLRHAGGTLGWFHASGTGRRTPGRLADTISWESVGLGLELNRYDGGSCTIVCFEGFGPAFRKGVPEIGNGFPKDLPPKDAIRGARKTLQSASII